MYVTIRRKYLILITSNIDTSTTTRNRILYGKMVWWCCYILLSKLRRIITLPITLPNHNSISHVVTQDRLYMTSTVWLLSHSVIASLRKLLLPYKKTFIGQPMSQSIAIYTKYAFYTKHSYTQSNYL